MSAASMNWPTYLSRVVVLGVVIFGAVRLAIARDGVSGGPARTSVTVSGTLTGVTGTPMATFHFLRRGSATDLCAPTAMITNRDSASGAFSVEVPLDACPTNLFDGSDVTISVDVGGMAGLVPAQVVNPVPYAHYASQYGSPDCPVGYERAEDPSFTGDMRLCQRSRMDGTTRVVFDEVVRVGVGATAFWIDRFEATICERANGTGMRYSGPDERYPSSFPTNGQWSSPLFALSFIGQSPSIFVTWFRAQEACAVSGKRLPVSAEWQRAARGTNDPGSSAGGGGVCNTMGSGIRDTGLGSRCVSAWGAQDMVGNVSEWTAEWDATLPEANVIGRPWPDSSYGDDLTSNISSRVVHVGDGTTVRGLPGALIRGGSYMSGTGGGIFYLGLDRSPSHRSAEDGFRCVIPR